MNFLEFKTLAPSFSSNRANLDDISNLLQKTNIAMRQVARDTIPLKLLKNNSSNREILRRIDANSYVCKPSDVTSDVSNLEMDTNLIDAVALFLMAGIETARAPYYMKQYWSIVEEHENSLINDDLSTNYLIVGDMSLDEDSLIVDRNEYTDYINDSTNEVNVKIVGEFNG